MTPSDTVYTGPIAVLTVLPNGWVFGLPNERYVTDGLSYDGSGIPPQIIEPVFTDEEFATRRDSAFDAAVHGLAP